jgi:hypothetical protein
MSSRTMLLLDDASWHTSATVSASAKYTTSDGKRTEQRDLAVLADGDPPRGDVHVDNPLGIHFSGLFGLQTFQDGTSPKWVQVECGCGCKCGCRRGC